MLKPVNHNNHEFSVDVHVQGTQMYCGSELALAVKREAEDVLVLLCAYDGFGGWTLHYILLTTPEDSQVSSCAFSPRSLPTSLRTCL